MIEFPPCVSRAGALSALLLMSACFSPAEPAQESARHAAPATVEKPACVAATWPRSEIENTTHSSMRLDVGTEYFLPDGKYRLRGGWGGETSGVYRLCGAALCIQRDGEAEVCQTLHRAAKGRYRDSSGLEMVFEPLLDRP